MTRSVTAVVIQHFSSHTFFLHASIAYHALHSPALPHRTSYFVPRTSCWASVTRMGMNIVAFFENFIGTGVLRQQGWGKNGLTQRRVYANLTSV